MPPADTFVASAWCSGVLTFAAAGPSGSSKAPESNIANSVRRTMSSSRAARHLARGEHGGRAPARPAERGDVEAGERRGERVLDGEDEVGRHEAVEARGLEVGEQRRALARLRPVEAVVGAHHRVGRRPRGSARLNGAS